MSKEMLLERLKLEEQVYRRMGAEYAAEAETEKMNMTGLFWLHRGKVSMCDSIADTLKSIIEKESK